MSNLFEIKNLNMHYPVTDGLMGNIKGYVYALNNVNLDIKENEILGLVGESGSGKSTLGNCILKLITPTSGEVLFKGENILNKKKKELKKFRKNAQMIFQNPYMSLNPRMKIYDILKEPLIISNPVSHFAADSSSPYKCSPFKVATPKFRSVSHAGSIILTPLRCFALQCSLLRNFFGQNKTDKKEINQKIKEIINLTGIREEDLNRYPHEFSGGQRQRIAIARAIITNPMFIVADEPVSALDVSIQAQIINLMLELKQHLNLTMLFISHDLSVIKYISDKIAVMYLGEIVEIAEKDELFNNHKHPYTQALLNAVPVISEDKKSKKIILKGDIPSPQNPPQGCKFHTRCPYVMEKCKTQHPDFYEVSNNHKVRCFLCENKCC